MIRFPSVDCSVSNTNTPAQLTRLAVCAISSFRSAASAEAFDSRFFSCTDDSRVRSVYHESGFYRRDILFKLTLLLVGLQDLPLRIDQLSFQLGQLQGRSLFGQLDLQVELPTTLVFQSMLSPSLGSAASGSPRTASQPSHCPRSSSSPGTSLPQKSCPSALPPEPQTTPLSSL